MQTFLQDTTKTLVPLLDSIGEGVLVADPAGTPVLWNAAAERILGLSTLRANAGRWTEREGVFGVDGVTPLGRDDRTLTRAIRGEIVTQRRGRVLVVDDNAGVGHSLARVLRKAHDVVIETDARSAALARLTAGETFDIIFCDLMMPNMTGLDLHAAVTALSPDVARRIVFLTGGAFSAQAKEFIGSVGNLTVNKPFDPERLRSIAKDYVR